MRQATAGLAVILIALAAPPALAQSVSVGATGGGTVSEGGTITAVFKPFNEGPGPVAAAPTPNPAILTLSVPPNMTLVSPVGSGPYGMSSNNGWVCGVPTLTCGFSGPGVVGKDSAFPTLTVVLKATALGPYKVCLTISRYQMPGETTPQNNKACVSGTVKPKVK